MTMKTVDTFAKALGVSVNLLLEQFYAAGIRALKPNRSITERDKALLLNHLRRRHGCSASRKTPTLSPTRPQLIILVDGTKRLVGRGVNRRWGAWGGAMPVSVREAEEADRCLYEDRRAYQSGQFPPAHRDSRSSLTILFSGKKNDESVNCFCIVDAATSRTFG